VTRPPAASTCSRPGFHWPRSSPLVYAVKHAVSEGIDGRVAVAAAVGLTSGVLFVRRQRRTADPLIDVTLFRNGAFSGAVVANFIAIFALMGLLFFFSQYLQLVRGFSPLQAGLAEMPATLASIVVVAAVGVVAGRLGRGRAVAAGLAVAALGLALVAVAERAPQYWWLGLTLVPVGLGVGLALTLTVDSVLSAVPRDKAGSASAISETAFELGAALGIALLGSVVTLVYRAFLPTASPVPAEVRDSLAAATTVLDPGSGLAQAARAAFTGAMQVTSLAAAAVTAVAAVIAWRTIPSGR
jgi:MFS transporter, DHA2 family, multidrug resistance protein